MKILPNDKNHPRLSRAEGLARLKTHGYVRMMGHSATDEESLDRMFGICDKIEDGSWGNTPTTATKVSAVQPGGLPVVSEEVPGLAKRQLADLNKRLESLEAANAELVAKLAAKAVAHAPEAPAAAQEVEAF